jgi:hypothetical protein
MPQMKRVVWMSLFLMGLCLNACWSPNPSDVPGIYTASASWGSAQLELRAEGTYVEKVFTSKRDPKIISGTWKFTEDHLRVIRTPCLNVDNEGSHQMVAYCDQTVTRTIGHVTISVDPDSDFDYLK